MIYHRIGGHPLSLETSDLELDRLGAIRAQRGI